MNDRVLGIAVIGCGRAGMIHARNFANRVKGARLVAVADVVTSVAQAASAEFGGIRYATDYRDILSDPQIDAVVVVSPTDQHRQTVLDCAASGKHILCEKPLAMNVSDCGDMIEACARHKVKLQLGFMRRFDQSHREAKRLLTEGAIGDLVLVKAHTRAPSKPLPWMYDLRQSNGVLAEVSSHDLDILRYFSGSEVASLYAIGGNFRNPEVLQTHPDYYDNLVMMGVFQSGAQFSLDGAAYVQYGYDAHVELIGTKGVLRVGRDNATFVQSATPGVGTASPFILRMGLYDDAYVREGEAFVQTILGDSTPEATGYDGLMAVKLAEAGNRSMTTGQIVRLGE